MASSTISSRPWERQKVLKEGLLRLDAAGLNGNARGGVYKDGSSEVGLDPEWGRQVKEEKKALIPVYIYT